MTTVDFITELFCRVDDAMADVPRHSQAKLAPREVVTLALLFALQGNGARAFWRGLTRDYRPLFPHLPDCTRLLRLFATRRTWADRFLAEPTLLAVADTCGLELRHPIREGRSPTQLWRTGLSNHCWIGGIKISVIVNAHGQVVDWDDGTANVHDNTFAALVGEVPSVVWTDSSFHAKAGDPPNMKVCKRGEYNDHMLIERVFSLLTVVSHFKQVAQRGAAYLEARVGYTLALFNVLMTWRGLPGDEAGRIRLAITEFSL